VKPTKKNPNVISIQLMRLEANLILEALADYGLKSKRQTMCSNYDVTAVAERILRALDTEHAEYIVKGPNRWSEADARLIAAAPELLEALIKLRNKCEMLRANGGPLIDLTAAYKAIEKAGGTK
jgi:hypothetical protein